MRPVLQVFAKAPLAGSVKTRLIPALGTEGAAHLHRLLTQRVLDVTAVAAADLGAEHELWCAPDTTHPFFVGNATRLSLVLRAQIGANLGERMHHALVDALARGGRPVLIGSDCPQRGADELLAALEALAGDADLVLQPAEDGGYALIGANRIDRALFDGVEWGGSKVLTQTLARADALGLRVHLLSATWDVDRPADLARLRARGLPGFDLLENIPT